MPLVIAPGLRHDRFLNDFLRRSKPQRIMLAVCQRTSVGSRNRVRPSDRMNVADITVAPPYKRNSFRRVDTSRPRKGQAKFVKSKENGAGYVFSSPYLFRISRPPTSRFCLCPPGWIDAKIDIDESIQRVYHRGRWGVLCQRFLTSATGLHRLVASPPYANGPSGGAFVFYCDSCRQLLMESSR